MGKRGATVYEEEFLQVSVGEFGWFSGFGEGVRCPYGPKRSIETMLRPRAKVAMPFNRFGKRFLLLSYRPLSSSRTRMPP
jgi:hypothetical protein